MNNGGYVAIYVVGVIVATMIGANKGKAGAGFLLGLFFSWLGALIALLLSPTGSAAAKAEGRRPCPYCAEMVMPNAVVCPHCGRDIAPAAPGLLSPAPAGTAEGWLPDPSGRHPDRWWDGTTWTKWVRDKPGGTRSEDPPLTTV